MVSKEFSPDAILASTNRTCAFGQVFGGHRQVWIAVRDTQDWAGAAELLSDSAIEFRDAPGFQENL